VRRAAGVMVAGATFATGPSVPVGCRLAQVTTLVVHAEARLAVTDVPDIVALVVPTAEVLPDVVAQRTQGAAFRLAEGSDPARLVVATRGAECRPDENQGESEDEPTHASLITRRRGGSQPYVRFERAPVT
jgi:hypothetical protein